MTDHNKSICKHSRSSSLPLWAKGLGLLGSMSFLSSGMIWAQTPSEPGTDSVVVPTTTTPSPTEAAPIAPPPAPIAPPEPSLPEATTPVPVTSEPVVPVVPVAPPSEPNNQPIPAVPPKQPAIDPGSAYIDKTGYSLGATDYQPPSSVVILEQSTGCRTLLQSGQSAGNLCSPNTPSSSTPTTAAQPNTWTPRSRQSESYPIVTPTQQINAIPIGPVGYQPGNPLTALSYYNRTMRPPSLLGNGNRRLMFPLSIPAPITSLFGWRTHPISGDTRFHSGTDLGAPMGTPVLAAYSGRVTVADFLGGYGLAVVLEHPDPAQPNQANRQTLYAHLSELFVQPGEWIEQGAVIGRVGSTGNSTGPHLHFEIRELSPSGWVAINPSVTLETALAQFLKAPQVEEFTNQLGLDMILRAGTEVKLAQSTDEATQS